MVEEGRKRINLTDGDVESMKSHQRIVAGYNLQAVVSPVEVTEADRTGLLITAAAVVRDNNDTAQLVPMLERAEEMTGRRAAVSLADAGYHSGSNLEACEQRQQVVVMPEHHEKALTLPYHKDRFTYDAATDSYTCPRGQVLRFTRVKYTRGTLMRLYRASGATCRKCAAFGTCTKDRCRGRALEIGPYDAVLHRHRVSMATEEAQAAYRRRMALPEPVFGILKEQMGVRRFLLRGLAQVQAEAKMLATAFNLRTLYRIWQGWSLEKRQLLIKALAA